MIQQILNSLPSRPRHVAGLCQYQLSDLNPPVAHADVTVVVGVIAARQIRSSLAPACRIPGADLKIRLIVDKVLLTAEWADAKLLPLELSVPWLGEVPTTRAEQDPKDLHSVAGPPHRAVI